MMPSYNLSTTMKVVRTSHVVTLFDRDCAGTILEVLRRVPPKARIVDVSIHPDETGLRIEFIEETDGD